MGSPFLLSINMALQSSGQISLGDIQTEFGGINPANLSEYYSGGEFVKVAEENKRIPPSGVNKLSNYYGSRKLTLQTLRQDINWTVYIDGSDYYSWKGNTLTITHRNYQVAGAPTIIHSTQNLTTNTLMNSGTIKLNSGGTGTYTLPFSVLKTTQATLTKASGRSQIIITELPTQLNEYKTTVLFNDDGPKAAAVYTATLTLSAAVLM
jgi:hypothetical protein